MGKQVETLQVKNGGELMGKILLLEFLCSWEQKWHV